MNLDFCATKLTKVKNITVPDIFNRRLKTGINQIDVLFDEGILPGSAATLTAKAGCGKTTFMLQMLNGLAKNGYSVGYFSGEESIYQLAYTAKRVNSAEVPVANVTDIDDICQAMKDLDLIVIDSFQALTSKSKMNARQLEKYAVQTITKRAKEVECTVIFIMHLTKSGDLKGGTIVPHTVDANLKIDRVDDVDDDAARIIYFEKNRFGPLNELECSIGRNGYEFNTKIAKTSTDDKTKAPAKKSRKETHTDNILNLSHITLRSAAMAVENNVQRARNILRDLETLGSITKIGRGADAYWVKK